MNTNLVPKPRSRLRRVVRLGFPQIVGILAVIICVATSIRAGHHVERQWFSLFRTSVVMVAVGLIAIWFIFYSGWRKFEVVSVLAVLSVVGWTMFRISYDGDLKPSIHLRDWVLRQFGASHDQEVDDHRRHQAELASRKTVDLSFKPGDSPGYRGQDRGGVFSGPPISRDGAKHPPRIVWKQPIYGGFSSFAVANGFLVTIEQRRDEEAVVCYDASDGVECWVHSWPGKFEESMGGPGPRSTPTIDGGEIFALGALGRLVCLDGKTGTLKWEVETLRGNKNLRWGMSASPLVIGDLVVVNPGSQATNKLGQALVAYDRHDGSVVWSSGKTQAGYSSPMLVTLCKRPQILLFDGAGLGGYDPKGGTELWRFSWPTQGSDGINVAQPIVLEGKLQAPIEMGAVAGGTALVPQVSRMGQVFIASAYGRGGALLQVEDNDGQFSVTEMWRTNRASMRCKVSSPVEHRGYAYGLDDGNLECIDLGDGRRMWKDERTPEEGGAFGQGQILLYNDTIIALTHYGEVVLVDAKPEGYHERGRLKVLKGEKTWSSPAIVNGLLYVRNHLEMACIDLR